MLTPIPSRRGTPTYPYHPYPSGSFTAMPLNALGDVAADEPNWAGDLSVVRIDFSGAEEEIE